MLGAILHRCLYGRCRGRFVGWRFLLGLGFLNNRLRTRLDPRRLGREQLVGHSLLLLFPALRKVSPALQFGYLGDHWQRRAGLNINERLTAVGTGRRVVHLKRVYGPSPRETPPECPVKTLAEWLINSVGELFWQFPGDDRRACGALQPREPRLDSSPNFTRHDAWASSRARWCRLGRGQVRHGRWVVGGEGRRVVAREVLATQPHYMVLVAKKGM